MELCDQLLRLTRRESEEARRHLVPVRVGQHLGQLPDGGEAQAAVPERLDDIGKALEQEGGALPVAGRAPGARQLGDQEGEESGVPE
jgi:hypothetical protein